MSDVAVVSNGDGDRQPEAGVCVVEDVTRDDGVGVDLQRCGECDGPAELKCSACKLVAYCSKDHQKAHWKTHKNMCRPFEVAECPQLGRHLVATRDLHPGDLVLQEFPIVYGPRPHMVEEGPVPCPGCCRLIIGESSGRCEGCDFPICHHRCEGLRNPEKHGHECIILSLRDVKAINGLHEFYRQDTLLALRCLILQKIYPKRYAKLMEMESHIDKRGEGTDIYKDVEERVADYLHDNFFGPLKILEGRTGQALLPDVSRPTIHKICGIIDVNALEINQDAEVSALYPTAYLLQHDCLPNTVHTFEDDTQSFRITVRAAVEIKKGDHITTMYTHALWGTQARREHLRETKYFSCRCRRCSDPTELGTYLSALRCMGGGETAQGEAVSPCGGTQLPCDPLDDETEWRCDRCPVRLTNGEVAYLVNQIGEEVDRVQLATPTVRELEQLLTKMLNFVHPNHYHVYAVKHSLIQLYGYQQGYTSSQISDDALKRKADMCRELLQITRTIDPGNARLALYRAVILHELHLANMIFVKRQFDIGIKSAMLRVLRECKEALAEAVDSLRYETSTAAGDKLLSLVRTSLAEFERWCARNKVDFTKDTKDKQQ